MNKNNFEVIPFIPQNNYRNDALNTDFYEFRMSISAGQEQLTNFLMNYHFDEVACEYLLAKGMDKTFVKYLSTYKWKGTMYAMPEGTIAYPNEPMVRITTK